MGIKKKLMVAISIIGVFLLMTACGSDSETQEGNKKEITLKFASGLPETHLLYTAVEKVFMERVTELTDGQVQFEHYPAEQLGKSADLISLTADGVADIAFYSPGYNPSKTPISSALYAMPGLYDSSEDISTIVDNLTKESPILETDFLNNGVRPIMTVFTPSYGIFTTDKEVKVPGDIKGLKLKAAGGVSNESLAYMGANPLTIPVSDLYSSMERNVVDGMHSYFQDVVVYNLEGILNYATIGMHFGGSGPGYAINEDLYQSLPENVQDAIMQAGEEVVESGSKEYDKVNKESMEQVKEDFTIHELTEDERTQWEDTFEEFNQIWIDKQNDEFIEAYEMLQKGLASKK